MRQTSRHLFVYGTLMTTAANARLGRAERARLQREGKCLGAASIEGRLYDLGRYPAVTRATGTGERVHGEIVLLGNPLATFRWLDVYENVSAGDPDREYDRIVCRARLASDVEVAAWVYVYRRSLSEAQRIADGRWQPR